MKDRVIICLFMSEILKQTVFLHSYTEFSTGLSTKKDFFVENILFKHDYVENVRQRFVGNLL